MRNGGSGNLNLWLNERENPNEEEISEWRERRRNFLGGVWQSAWQKAKMFVNVTFAVSVYHSLIIILSLIYLNVFEFSFASVFGLSFSKLYTITFLYTFTRLVTFFKELKIVLLWKGLSSADVSYCVIQNVNWYQCIWIYWKRLIFCKVINEGLNFRYNKYLYLIFNCILSRIIFKGKKL